MPISVHIMNIGNLFGIAAGVLLLAFSVFNKPISHALGVAWQHKIGKITLSAIFVFLILGVLLCAVLSVMMISAKNKKLQFEPQAIIVLGCKVRDGVPSKMLRKRLEVAYDALQQYPQMICVVSGGKGADETISEAQCMYEWLTAKGIDENRIIMEDKSTSTSENFRFSKEILERLDCIQDSETEILIATDCYHQMRAQYLAKLEGITNVAAASADTQTALLPTYWVREWFGIVHAVVFGN